MIVITCGPASSLNPHRDCRHAPAPDWPGPLCNLGTNRAVKRITGVLALGAVSCWRCRQLLAGGGP